MKNSNSGAVRCGIILAGGEGKRLQPFIQRLRGDTFPKQYVNFIGTRSMLDHTHHHAEMLIAPERVFTVISEGHLRHKDVCRQLFHRPKGTVILQPENKDTGPGLLLPLIHIAQRHPNSVVTVFPSDHFILEEELFMGYVNSACRAVERDPSRLVLLGAEPYAPETQYGYILPGSEAKDSPCPGLHPVLRFIEKPGQHTARELLQWGSLWNTLVMVFQTRTMLNLVRRAVPVLYRAFERIEEALGTPQEKDILEETYRDTTPWNFSRGLLEMLPSLSSLSLSVLTLRGVFWSDWGSEARILSDLKKLGFTARLRELDARLQQSAMRPGDLHTEIGLHDKDDLACF